MAFGQTQPAASSSAMPPALRAIFATQLASQLAAADTVTVSITPGGVVPVYSSTNTVQSGSWVSIYGQNLAPAVATWNGDFPQQLGGTTVTVNNRPAYLWFVSPGQINLQTPDDTATGTVPVVVTNGNGSATSTVTLSQFGPSWSLLDSKHVAGIIFRNDGSGSQGGGSYDIIGPTGSSLGFPTKAAKAGDVVELFAVGFGPTDPAVPAGQAFGSSAKVLASSNLQISIGGTPVTPAFAGLTQAGLYQINLTIPPGLGSGDVPLSAIVGGAPTPSTVVISLQ
ncbi:MAG TPA: IPT/TIG domain-containing protein [Bryobacteraceae bacterium]|nr:IPT/TIG domain-containing protein [Bryobacteraceae bacterium]